MGKFLGIAYGILFCVICTFAVDTKLPGILIAVTELLLFVLLAIYTVKECLSYIKNGNWKQATDMCFRIKRGMIPFYIILFVWGAILLIVPMGFVLVPIPLTVGYVILLASSIHGVIGLIVLEKERDVPPSTIVLHLILHFCFCLDIFSAYICRKNFVVRE